MQHIKRSLLPTLLPALLTLGGSFALTHPAAAQSSLFSEAIVGVDNTGDNGIHSLDFQYVGDNSVATARIDPATPASFTGLDSMNTTRTMLFDGVVRGQSDYGRLHSYAYGNVVNSYYNANNAVYANPDGSSNTAGSPTSLVGLGFAGFTDTLQYGGALSSGYKAIYLFHVDGTNSGVNMPTWDGSALLADLAVNVDANPGEGFFFGQTGYSATDVASSSFAVNGTNAQTINIQFSSQFVLNTWEVPDGTNAYGSSDFSSTLTLTGIELVDANGSLLSGWTVTSSSGTRYNAIQGVPEPGSLALVFGMGTVGLGAFLKRKRNASAR